MLIDLILNRKDGQPYNAKKFYDAVTSYLDTFPCYIGLARALDGGEEEDVITELCDYIKSENYNLDICDYISSVKWLEDDPKPMEEKIQTIKKWLSTHDGNLIANDINISLTIFGNKVECESLWLDGDKLYVHCCCKEFEGDIDSASLADNNIAELCAPFEAFYYYVEQAKKYINENKSSSTDKKTSSSVDEIERLLEEYSEKNNITSDWWYDSTIIDDICDSVFVAQQD